MALLQMNYYSQALQKNTTVHIVLPNDVTAEMTVGNDQYKRAVKTLFLLHGFSGNSLDWLTGSNAQEMALKYNLALVMPSGDNSFYLDAKGTGHAYATFVGEELPAYISRTFGLSQEKKNTYIGGLSMGGFGAIHTGLKYPDSYEKIFGFSSAFIVNQIMGMLPGTEDDIADYHYYASVFGDLNELEKSENNPQYLIRQLRQNQKEIPPIFMACGTEDFLLQQNREFKDFLEREHVNVTYRESSGIHDWKFWNTYLEPAIQWMLS